MRFIMKHLSKKMLSVILALMILLSAVSVAFSALAQGVPYVVTMGKPAIAMQSGYTLDLNKINVMFGDTEVPGDEITWTAEENSAIKFDSAAKTVMVFKSGTYILTATKTNEPGSTRTIYLSASEGTPTTEVAVYEHPFTADDLTDSGEFTAESGWKTVITDGTGKPAYDDGAIGIYGATSIYYVLDPASSAANAIKTFPDITLEATIYTKLNSINTKGWYGLLARVNYTNNTVSATPESNVSMLYKHTTQRSQFSEVRFNISGDETAVDDALDILPNKRIPRNKLVKFKLQLNGGEMSAYYDIADGNGYLEVPCSSNLSATQKTALAATAGNGGTIAIYSDKSARVGISAVKASIAFTQDELDKIANACTKNEIYTISKTKPAIVVITGKTIDLNKILVEFDDGSLALGSEINWSTTSGAIILDAAKNTLSVFKSGSHVVTATQKADQSVSKEIYIFADDVAKTQVALIDYTFSEADAGTTDANGVYTFGGNDGKLFQIYLAANTAVNYGYPGDASGGNVPHDDANAIDGDGGYNHHVAPAKGIYTGSGTPFFTVNPDSKQGSMMVDFPDLTIVYRGNIHPNSVSLNTYTLPIVGKYQMVGSTPSFENDTYVGYKAPLSSVEKGGLHYNAGDGAKTYTGANAVANPYRAIGQVSGSIYKLTESDYDFRMQYKGNDFTISVKGEKNTDDEYVTLYTTVGDSSVPAALTNIASQKGTFMASTAYLSSQYFKAYIEFTADELASLEKCYVTNNYFIVSTSKPAIPAKLNTKVSLDNMVVEMADGTFMKGSDVVWESTNGALFYDNADNTISAYRNGSYALIAKKNATDTSGKEIYVLINDELKTEIDLYSHTFSPKDVGVTDENGIYGFGSTAAEKPWVFYTDPNTNVQWSAGGDPDGGGASGGIYSKVEMGINIGDSTGYLVLNPKSAEGKLVGSFSDYTIIYRATLHPNYVVIQDHNAKTATMVGRYVMTGDKPDFANDRFLGYDHRWHNTYKGSLYYNATGTAKSHTGNAVAYTTYNGARDGGEGDLDFKMEYNGANFTFSVKGAADETTYSTLYTMALDDNAPFEVLSLASQAGTFAINNNSEKNITSQNFRVYVSFAQEDLNKLVYQDIEALYNIEQSCPAVPLNKANKLLLSTVLVESPDKNFKRGDVLDWSTTYVGSDFHIDNEAKVIYAYGEGRYEVKVTNPADNSEVMTLYFIVSSDGIYRLFNHTFTKADLDALSTTGKSDMWISKTYSSNKASTDVGYPGTPGAKKWPISWKNNTVALKDGENAQFDENKGISLYSSYNNLLLLNPECDEAKVIAKFRDYNIDFTSSAREKAIDNAAWPTMGNIGALGRVNFGDDDEFDFMYGTYLNAYSPGSIQDNEFLAMTIGMAIDLNNLKVEKVSAESTDYHMGNEYTWTLNLPTENLVIDNDAKTITAKAAGVYPVTATKDGVSKTYSIIVGNGPMDHHIMGIFNVTTDTPTVNVNTPAGYAADNYLKYTYDHKNMALTSPFTYNVPNTYNFRVQLNGNNISLSVAPNGTANYTEIFDSDKSTLNATKKESIASGNVDTGTIGLYSSSNACAYFKSISVSLDFDSIPHQEPLGECYEEDGRYVYMQVGQILDLTQVNFEAGNKYHNGANITFTNAPDGRLSIKNGVSITANKEGVYTLNATDGKGTNFTVIVVVSAAGAIYISDNYNFESDGRGTITGYSRNDDEPYSEYIKFPSELGGEHIYEVGSALAVGNPYNVQLVELEIQEFIEKIGNGAFIGATKLKKVTIPNTVTTIGDSAFAGATALESLFIPGSVSKIGDYAFQNCNVDVIIANPNAEIGKDAFTDGAIIYGYAGSTAQAYATENNIAFVELTGEDKTKAEESYNEWLKFSAERKTKVNTTVEWEVADTSEDKSGQYKVVNFKFTDRSAGKFIIPSKIEFTVNGVKKTVDTVLADSIFSEKHDNRAIYAIELAEGNTSIAPKAFYGCYNLSEVKLPEGLISIHIGAFRYCVALEKIDIPDSVILIGRNSFSDCTNLKEINVNHETSRLQLVGADEIAGGADLKEVFYNTQVENFVFPVTVEVITNTLVNSSKLNEVWIYNKDVTFELSDEKNQYFFNKGTIIHGVPGSTAEALVKADEALKDHEDPEMRKNYRGLIFKGDIEDFYTTQENVADTNGKFIAKYVSLSSKDSKELYSPYYAIYSFVGKGGKVVMPAYLDVGEDKKVPIYAVSSDFLTKNLPTNGIDRIINLEISEGIAEIEDEALSGANHLKSVKFPSTLLYIGKKAFTGCGLTGKLEIPKNVSEIGRNAFRNNANLTDVVILNPNIKLGASLFDSTITIHGIKGSTAEAYATKNKLKFVEIAAPSATTVADFSDNGNYKFTVTDGYITGYERLDAGKEFSLKITIPANIGGVAIKGIKEGAFDLGAEATSIIAIEIQDGVTDIEKNAFKGLKKLAYVKFPNTLKVIGESAFEETSLAGDITLPESLEKIEKNAFKNLGRISSITVLGKTTVIEGTALPRNNKDLVICGYTGSTAEEWAKNFKFTFEYLDGGPQENPDDKDPDYTDEPSEEVGDNGTNEVVRVIRQSNLAIIIVIAVAMLLFAILLAAVVVVLVIIKKKRDEEEMYA